MSAALSVPRRDFLHPSALVLPEGLGFQEWEELGTFLRTCEGAVQWWIGDWVNFGERSYGEKYAQALDATGYDYQTVANSAWVAGRVQFSRRRENLSFAHHAEIASLEPDVQESLLTAASSKGLSRKDFREAVRTYKAGLRAPTAAHPVPTPAPERWTPTPRPGPSESPEDMARTVVDRATSRAQPEAKPAPPEELPAPRPDPYVLLRDIREALGVATDAEILPAIQRLRAVENETLASARLGQ